MNKEEKILTFYSKLRLAEKDKYTVNFEYKKSVGEFIKWLAEEYKCRDSMKLLWVEFCNILKVKKKK